MSNRIQKVNELIKEEVGAILQSELGEHTGLVTVTAVETTADLRQTTIWYRVIGGDEIETQNLLEERERGIQQTLNSRLSMKYVPKITFRFDKSGDYVDKINELLKETEDESFS